MTRIAWVLVCWGLLLVPCAVAQSGSLAPNYWKERLFYIPYQVNQRSKLLNPIEKVQLLLSRTGANDWATLEEAEPNVQGFSYHVAEDGEFWFALRHLDRRGQPQPSADVQPQMRIVVDTAKPKLTLEGTPDLTGEIIFRYEARDTNLRPESLIVEVRGAGRQWSPLSPSTPDIAQSNRLVGRVRWRPPAGVESVEVRAAIADHAGHYAQADTKVSVRSNQLSQHGPAIGDPSVGFGNIPQRSQFAGKKQPGMVSDSFASTARLPSQNWPASNRLPPSAATAQIANRQSPPPTNPYSVADRDWPSRTPAKLVGDGWVGSNRSSNIDGGTQSLQITPLGPGNTSQLAQEKVDQHDWVPAQTPTDHAIRAVNSRTFDVDYDLQSVGPWGIAKVELWGTHDGGRTWQSYGVDSDNRSPIRVTVPTAGTFGFRILVDGANSAGAATPQPGDEPELLVAVDLQPPTTELLAAELGQGNLADHLQVRWTATDTNLEPRPIALFYSSYPNGPWSMIASGLENTGSYTWRIERHVPARFYLRLEARDTAGNLATYQTSSPVALARPQPTGRLRSVRPISSGARP